ncbi:hypothetical protein PC41400_01885 [Paenibacillus chitinolyticus]|uniref:Uncharacterized protein n=1 Tax=Paenibacillus chitinolyticus TaxID=79263 RepID=A0A410WQ93_9BACL|nr:hypothetical protein PC41400_01885 [Paenibacillus chitinolyticus]
MNLKNGWGKTQAPPIISRYICQTELANYRKIIDSICTKEHAAAAPFVIFAVSPVKLNRIISDGEKFSVAPIMAWTL